MNSKAHTVKDQKAPEYSNKVFFSSYLVFKISLQLQVTT